MIRGLLTHTILWCILALAWDPFTSTVEKTQAVDKTQVLIYNELSTVKARVKDDDNQT